MHRGTVFVIVAALAVALAACGGSSSGGPVIQPPAACATLANLTAATPGTVVTAIGSSSTCDLVAVDLIVTDVNDLFGMGVTISYNPAVATYDSASTTGSVLTSDGAGVTEQELSNPGQLVLGLSRLGVTTGVNATGNRLLVRLFFRRVGGAGAMTPLTLSGTQLLDSQTPPQPIGGVSWSGADFVVQ